MRKILEFDGTKGVDTRCVICRNHYFLVFDVTDGSGVYLHSYIDYPLKFLSLKQMIHWEVKRELMPICIDNYKEIVCVS